MESIMRIAAVEAEPARRPELLSAAVDGEGELDAVLSELDEQDQARWRSYHLIGDALRSEDLILDSERQADFVARMRVRLETEPHHVAAAAAHRFRSATLRRRALPPLAAAAAAATLTWLLVPTIQHAGAGATLAQREPSAVIQLAARGPAPVSHRNLVGDPSLSPYLEAHQQFIQDPVTQGAMPYIRVSAAGGE